MATDQVPPWWKLLYEAVIPPLKYLRIKKLLTRELGSRQSRREHWKKLIAGNDEWQETVYRLYASEVERLRSLQDKLRGTLAFVSPLIPLVATLFAIAIRNGKMLPALIGAIATIQFLFAYFLFLQGVAARKTNLLTTATLDSILQSEHDGLPVIRICRVPGSE